MERYASESDNASFAAWANDKHMIVPKSTYTVASTVHR